MNSYLGVARVRVGEGIIASFSGEKSVKRDYYASLSGGGHWLEYSNASRRTRDLNPKQSERKCRDA